MYKFGKRKSLALLFVLMSTAAFADSVGAVNYTYGYNGLKDMCTFVLEMMTVVMFLLYAIASLITVYSSCAIYIKMNTGGDGITKDIVMLVGACLFLIGSMTVLPAFFDVNFDQLNVGSLWKWK